MAKYSFTPLEGENVIAEFEGELWAVSANIIARLIGAIARILACILGVRRSAMIVVTNKRIMIYNRELCCWCYPTGAVSLTLNPSEISSVGYVRLGTCCQKCHLNFSMSSSLVYQLQMKGAVEKDVQQFVNAIYSVIKAS